MVNRDAALAQHRLEIAVAHPIAALPPDRPEHDLALEVTPLEVRHCLLPASAQDPSRWMAANFATEPFRLAPSSKADNERLWGRLNISGLLNA